MGNISSATDRKTEPASQANGLSARFKRFFSRSTPPPPTQARTSNGRRVAIAPANVAPARKPARQASSTTTVQPSPVTQRRATASSTPAHSSSSSRKAIPFPLPSPGDVLIDGFEVPPPPPYPEEPVRTSPAARVRTTPSRAQQRTDEPPSLDSSCERTPARPEPKMITVPSRSRESKYQPEMTPPLPLAIQSPPQTPAVPASPVFCDTLTPAQAAQWVVATAHDYGGASISDFNLPILWVEIESHVNVWTPAHLQAMGQALGDVFKPRAGIGALSHEMGYAGLERLMRECFVDTQPVLSPVQLGAFFGGVRRCLRADLPGADTRFLRILSEAVQAQVPTDYCVAMACGFFRANQASASQPYTPSKLTIAVPQSYREAVLETLNWGKRLALDPMSFYNRGVRVMPGKRYPWLMMAYEMPGAPASGQGPSIERAAQLQRAASTMTPPEKRAFLVALKSARTLPDVERKGK